MGLPLPLPPLPIGRGGARAPFPAPPSPPRARADEQAPSAAPNAPAEAVLPSSPLRRRPPPPKHRLGHRRPCPPHLPPFPPPTPRHQGERWLLAGARAVRVGRVPRVPRPTPVQPRRVGPSFRPFIPGQSAPHPGFFACPGSPVQLRFNLGEWVRPSPSDRSPPVKAHLFQVSPRAPGPPSNSGSTSASWLVRPSPSDRSPPVKAQPTLGVAREISRESAHARARIDPNPGSARAPRAADKQRRWGENERVCFMVRFDVGMGWGSGGRARGATREKGPRPGKKKKRGRAPATRATRAGPRALSCRAVFFFFFTVSYRGQLYNRRPRQANVRPGKDRSGARRLAGAPRFTRDTHGGMIFWRGARARARAARGAKTST